MSTVEVLLLTQCICNTFKQTLGVYVALWEMDGIQSKLFGIQPTKNILFMKRLISNELKSIPGLMAFLVLVQHLKKGPAIIPQNSLNIAYLLFKNKKKQEGLSDGYQENKHRPDKQLRLKRKCN